MSSNPSQLFLLADHIKLSLLERQRAISLSLEPNTHDGQISRSLESLQSGIEALEAKEDSTLTCDLTSLKTQLSTLQSQFHGFSTSNSAATLTSPNTTSLAPTFAAAQRIPPASKSVRFTDNPSASPDASNPTLFPAPYTDDPTPEPASASQGDYSNQQIHAYHNEVIQDQNKQLETLGRSIGRQRELGMQIGDELESQMMLIDDVDEGVERHRNQIGRARKRLDRFGRKAKENWSLSLIVVLIIILVLLIVVLK